MSITSQLKEIVDGVARSGALTPDAIRQFDEFRKRAEELEAILRSRTEERDRESKYREAAQSQLKDTTEKLTVALKRAETAEATNREADFAKLRSQYDKEARTEMRSILSDVFRNIEVRRMLDTNVSHAGTPPYPGAVPPVVYATDTKTEVETRK